MKWEGVKFLLLTLVRTLNSPRHKDILQYFNNCQTYRELLLSWNAVSTSLPHYAPLQTAIFLSNSSQNMELGDRQYGPHCFTKRPSRTLSARLQAWPYSYFRTSSRKGTAEPGLSLGKHAHYVQNDQIIWPRCEKFDSLFMGRGCLYVAFRICRQDFLLQHFKYIRPIICCKNSFIV